MTLQVIAAFMNLTQQAASIDNGSYFVKNITSYSCPNHTYLLHPQQTFVHYETERLLLVPDATLTRSPSSQSCCDAPCAPGLPPLSQHAQKGRSPASSSPPCTSSKRPRLSRPCRRPRLTSEPSECKFHTFPISLPSYRALAWLQTLCGMKLIH